jgi:hypothetical protein
MDQFEFYDYRKKKFHRNKIVQDVFIVLTAPVLMLVGMVISWFLWH